MRAKDREAAEAIFDKSKRPAGIGRALAQEHARHDAAIANMQRLRSLRLQSEARAHSKPH